MGIKKKTELNARRTKRQRADLFEVNIMANKISLSQGQGYTEREIMSDKMDWTGNTSLTQAKAIFILFLDNFSYGQNRHEKQIPV